MSERQATRLPPSPVSQIHSRLHAYRLDELHVVYRHLTTSPTLLTDTIHRMPSDILVYLPLVTRE